MLQQDTVRRSFYAAVPIILAIALVGLLVLMFGWFKSDHKPFDQFSRQPVEEASAILARRIISIPFGIDTNLAIIEAGGGVMVSGHGVCPAQGEYFQLKSTVTQAVTGVRAKGRTEAVCSASGPSLWSLQAVTPDSKRLEAGPAQACAQAVIHTREQGALVYEWCKDVSLQ